MVFSCGVRLLLLVSIVGGGGACEVQSRQSAKECSAAKMTKV